MLATLPMYDLPELRPYTDAFWTAIATRLRARGITAPDTLMRCDDLMAMWTDPHLLLGQTCGYPLVTNLAGKVAAVATPCYRAQGCEDATYRSAIVVRNGDSATSLIDLRGRCCAINEKTSNSGMNVLRAAIAGLSVGTTSFFSEIVMTGAHVASISAVAEGRADVAAIDCVTWAHLQRWRPNQSGRLRVLDWTDATPGLPFITSNATPDLTRRALADTLDDVIADPALAALRDALLLDRFVRLPPGAYDRLLEIERAAEQAGYPTLQ